MIIPDRRKAATLILSRLGSQAPVAPQAEVSQDDAPLRAIAEDLLVAFEKKSVMDIVDSLKAFIAATDTEE